MDNIVVGGSVTHHRFEILLSTSVLETIADAIAVDVAALEDLALVRTVSFQFYRRERLESLVHRRPAN